MEAIILSIGDELVLGQIVDTNSAWLSAQLGAAGCRVVAHVTVGDDLPDIVRAIRDAADRCDVLTVTGGLGPTADDLTREALAQVLQAPLELRPDWLAQLEQFFRKINRPMAASNRVQAMVPRGAEMLWNHCGTAPGIHAGVARPGRSTPMAVFVMPGVPREMKEMFQRDVLPKVRAASGGVGVQSRALHTCGLGESAIAELLGDLMHRDRRPSVGTTASGGIVSVRINSQLDNPEQTLRELEATSNLCRQRLGDLVFGQDEQTLAGVVAELLSAAPTTLATAESCTGGLLAKMLTDIPGASDFFEQGWVVYANDKKTQELDVDPRLIETHGAVSEPVATAMAQGARLLAGSDVAVSITGIAGPDGGTPQKPVGTVCIALAHADGASVRTFVFPGDRETVRDRAAKTTLALLRMHLMGRPAEF